MDLSKFSSTVQELVFTDIPCFHLPLSPFVYRHDTDSARWLTRIREVIARPAYHAHTTAHTLNSCCSSICEGPIRYKRPCGRPVDRIWLCIVHPRR
ncbi:hypothetical protein B0H14DRAFT_3463745 [Mycena olivaceomarginata]|nr:hypothetical protein B0H14DRAFT_3463745 [Mycena olivaceomarginata]